MCACVGGQVWFEGVRWWLHEFNVPTRLCSCSVVIHRLPIFHDLDGGIARHFEPARYLIGYRCVHFGHRYRRVVLLKSLGDFFILWGKLFAVATPKRIQKEDTQKKSKLAAICKVCNIFVNRECPGGITDLPRGIKLNQHRVFAFHEGVIIAVGENQHSVLFFHLCVILLLTGFFFFSIFLLLCNISQQTRKKKGHKLIPRARAVVV